MFLSGIRKRQDSSPQTGFPWSLPLFRDLDELSFRAPVTFLVGENGAGKSTLLEGLAVGMDAVAVGSRDLARDETLAAARALARGFRFVRRHHARVRMFLRAEDVFGFTGRLAAEMADLKRLKDDFRERLPDGSHGQALAMGVAGAQYGALAERYGADPDARSHGETFLAVLKSRLAPRGLYFLDEPETPLSPSRVLALIALLRDCVADGSQLVIATHSPILMALPGAEILLIEDGAIRPVAFDEVEHVRLTRAFLNDPVRYLRHL